MSPVNVDRIPDDPESPDWLSSRPAIGLAEFSAIAVAHGLPADTRWPGHVGRLDFTTGLLRYVNAGHPEALVCDGANDAELGVTGPLIGPFAGEWQTREAIIGPGQMLVCYTDGLTEVRNEAREEFGLDRLRRVLRDNYGDDTDSIVKQCLSEVDAYGGGSSHDDVTLVVIARALAQ